MGVDTWSRTSGSSNESGGHVERYVLGVDLGTGGPKVVLAGSGGVLGHEAEKVGVLFLPGGGAEQDPQAWWQAIVTATRRLLGRQLVPVGDIAAICMRRSPVWCRTNVSG